MTIPEMPFLQVNYEGQGTKHPTLIQPERLLLICWTVLLARQHRNVNNILHME